MTHITRARTALATLLFGTALALPLAQGAAPQAAHAASGPTPAQASVLGTWHNADPTTRDVTRIRVTYDSFWQKDRVEVWGKCSPSDCDWGTQDVLFYTSQLGPDAIGHIQYYTLSHSVNIKRDGSHLLVVDFFIPFPWDPRPPYTNEMVFIPGA
jgi:hypothetical protein